MILAGTGAVKLSLTVVPGILSAHRRGGGDHRTTTAVQHPTSARTDDDADGSSQSHQPTDPQRPVLIYRLPLLRLRASQIIV